MVKRKRQETWNFRIESTLLDCRACSFDGNRSWQQATMSAAQLVACFIQRLCVLYDFDPKGFDLPYSKTLIASRLGMELETFSRTLAKLKVNGIMVEGNRVTIHDLERIGQYVCGFCSISGECATHEEMEKKMCEDSKGIAKKSYM